MSDKEDTVDTSWSGQEAAWLAMAASGSIPNVEVRDINEDISEIGQHDLAMFELARDVVEDGASGGQLVGKHLLTKLQHVRGRVILGFSGWADDRRALFEIPIVVEFCRGLLFNCDSGLDSELDYRRAQRVLRILLNEDEMAFVDGKLVSPAALEAAGGCWLVSHCFPALIFVKTSDGPTGLMKDHALAFLIRNWLLGEGECPLQNHPIK